jgi:hypothetical protein
MKSVFLPWLIILVIAASSCNSGGMPLERPADFTVQLNDGGGMMPESETIFLSADSCWYENWYNLAHNHHALPVSVAELDSLYQELRHQGAMNIVSKEEGMVYDRGGTSISLSFANHHQQIVNAGSSFIAARHAKQYQAVVDAIWAVAHRHIRRMKVDVPFTVIHHADSMATSYVNLSVDGQPVYNWEATRDEPFSVVDASANLLPGNHDVNAWAELGGKQVSADKALLLTGPASKVEIHIWPDSIVVR